MSVDVFDLEAVIRLNTKEYEAGLTGAQTKTHSFASKLGSGLSKAAKIGGVALGATTAAAGAFVKKSIDAGKEFDASMSQVAATLGYSVDEINDKSSKAGQNFEKLRDFAQEMGRTTKYSATEASDALNYMALAGYDAEKSMDMLPTVLNLAAAGNMDLATASDMVTDAQTALNLSMEDTSKMTDQMAKAASSSNTSVSQLGSAFLTVGATARSVKGGTREMSQVLGLMADNGIKGSEAGTKYRNMLLKLIKPTSDGAAYLEKFGEAVGHNIVFDEKTGEMREFKDIFLDLNTAMEGMTKGEKDKIMANLFNTRDLSAANALLGTTKDRWEELGAKIDDAAGSAEKMAGTQMDNLQGDITLFKSAWEGLQIAVSDGATPAIRDFVKFGSEGVSRLAESLKNGGITEAFGTLGDIISKGLEKLISGLPKAIKAGSNLLSAIIKGITKSVPQLSKAAVEIVNGLMDFIIKSAPELLQAGFDLVVQLGDGIAKALPDLLNKAVDLVLQLAQKILDNAPKIVQTGLNLLVNLAQGILKAIPQIVKALPKLIKSLVDGILKSIPMIIQAGVDLLTSLVEDLPTIIDSIVTAIPDIIMGIVDALVNNVDKIIEAGVELFTSLITNLPEIILKIVAAIPKIITGIVKAIVEGFPKLIGSGLKIAWNIVKGILNFIVDIPKNLAKFIGAIIDYFASGQVFLDLLEAGKGIIEAVWKGLKAAWEAVKEWFMGILNWVTEKVKEIWDKMKELANADIGGNLKRQMEEAGLVFENGQWTMKNDNTKNSSQDDKSVSRLSTSAIKEAPIARIENNNEDNKKVLSKLDEIGNKIATAVDKSGNATIQINGRDFGRAVRTYA